MTPSGMGKSDGIVKVIPINRVDAPVLLPVPLVGVAAGGLKGNSVSVCNTTGGGPRLAT